ncbi:MULTISPECIES: hypothetical protein [unclassified Butyrivibrio]|jgi:hypothetical protein|uniref:hypothetical protein n=1 Tax=unclassified Butyrivibrio TaxID=2639466 RepID=UPI0003B3FA5E|nr:MULTISPECIES: hypothetical protein [unclassified Butyrivibrio]MBE5838626.1 hypothetical protein [Butyrivibrio sp.]MBP3818797.1 hypothetical protein [Butyrivibrio sp.]MBQ6414862.1 hypothetical protein [Butyrivibrio sp.]MBQ9303967.1 hypothetical protein [Butyrivibrio sp.]SEG12196.1 hypothetical protein SAMN02910276_01945 [Butyrivibrio sp. Su6]
MSSIIQNNQVFNNEIPFCRVYSIESKKQLEERFLAHRISYFIEWQDKSFLQRLFDRSGSKIVCTFKINKGEIARAKALAQGIEGIKFKDYGEEKNTERIRKRSDSVVKESDGLEMPELKFETSQDDYEE